MTENLRLRRFSRFMARLCAALMVVAPVGLILLWLNFGYVEPFMKQQLGIPPTTTITTEAKFLAAIVTFLRLSIGLVGLWALGNTFREGAEGRFFSADAVGGFRHFSWAVVAYVIAGPIEHTLLVLVLTLGNPEGERMLSISFGTPDLLSFFVALLFVAVAHVFREGQRLREENEGFL